MKSFIRGLLLASVSSFALAGNHGPCKIKNLQQTDSAAKFVMVTMACDGTDLATSCTNIQKDKVIYDATTEVGKVRTSMLLSAFAAQKEIQISTWGACPTEVNSVPLIYSIIAY